ncbi:MULTISPECIES: AAA family ATPase [Azotobacter]|jgi:chromosome partitioning protein|uniref:Plasmid segregation oscillating ATPase ParF n=1 Tax=Azotobacter beijerinckii TaxID=170623 RepID=A0A1H6ZB85_9GAMM|nr:AAA family ATPase [Azotobacter beijerinckii]MDV7211331.1 AAA family ATPase [Azotobacter beijerinckii]SEJ49986.1 plasmid segregation oscillating ATPase ParF [Azotobacter beijerinckii]SFL56824.1 plasmid segregation oscillating ATPase ParF [Azotobacter beijerinckii]
MIITVGNTKGGVGKTTVAVNLAAALALKGRDVWLVDGDRQGTAQTAISVRLSEGRTPGIAVAQYVDGQTLRGQVLQQRSKYQDIIIDAGGRDSTSLRAALILSDVLLVPFQPRSFDVWALADISHLVQEARSVRDGLKAFALLNMADPSSSNDNSEAAAAVADWPELELLNVSLVRRKAFANAASQGLCVQEMQPRDSKACAELEAMLAVLD